MTSINFKRLEQEIRDLEEESEQLRDQIYLLENKEAKIGDKIIMLKKQLSTLKAFHSEQN